MKTLTMFKAIRNCVQKRRLRRQLRRLDYSNEATKEILRWYEDD